jgi:DnaJ-class molecular chaperone
MKCQDCNGAGYDVGLVCPSCGFDDVILDGDEGYALCLDCDYRANDIKGQWETKTRCPVCNGTGRVEESGR